MNTILEDEKAFVKKVKKHFNRVYVRGNNDVQLRELIDLLDVQGNKKYLDLGTGSGYVSFGIAKRCPSAYVDGLDIVEEMRDRNQDEAQKRGLDRLSFFCYDGTLFPMEDTFYDGIIARYTLHHFPNIERTVSEMDRILKKHSRIVICDCVPTNSDEDGFIDKWMQVLGDGHISFRRVEEYKRLLGKYGFTLKKVVNRSIMCPRDNNETYRRLISENLDVADSYHYMIEKETIWLDEPVVYLAFER